jgi:hypothetical protein
MGMISSKIEGGKVVSMNMSAPVYKDVVQTIENNSQLKKYSEYLNENGFITVKVNVKILHDLVVRIYNRLDLQNAPAHIKDLKKHIQFNEEGVTPNLFFLLFSLGTATMSGFFTLREDGLLEQVKKNSSKVQGGSGIPEPQKMDISKPFVEIVFPKILILAKNDEFIDFLANDFHPKNENKMTQGMRKLIDTVLDGVNKNTSKGDIRLANMINLLFNVGLIASLVNFFMPLDPNNTPLIIAELIAETISSFPDDHCYFSNKSIISFDPNVCEVPKTPEKVEAQKAAACPPAPECPVQKVGSICPPAPVCEKNTNNTALFMVCGILALLAFTFFFLFITAKPKVIRVPMSLSDTE